MVILTGNIYTDILAIVVSILAVIVALFKWSFGYWQRQGVYTPQTTIPFGNAKDALLQKLTLGIDIKNAYDDIKSKGNKFGGYYFFGKPIFIPVDLDLVKSMLIKDFTHFRNHVTTTNESVDPLTGNLFFLKDDKWRNLRAKLTPTFTSGKMKMMFQTLVDCSGDLVTVIDDHINKYQPIDIKDVVARFTTDIVASCAFGIDGNCLKNPNSEFRHYGKKVFNLSAVGGIVRLLTFTLPNVLVYLKIRSFKKDISDFFINLVKECVNYREKNNIHRKDFMHLLIQLRNNVKITENDLGCLKNSLKSNEDVNESNGTLMTIEELSAQAFVFFVAGFETSSATTTFCLYELVHKPKYQDKVREEIDTVLEKYNGKLTYEALTELTYMEKCINETLRKYPPIPVHTRECTKTYKVPGTDIVLEKGSFVIVPAMGIQNDPEYFPDPDEFDPERFSEENKVKRHSAAWIPFGDGPRTCIGLRFGIMQVKVGLATLLKNYKFTLNSKTEVPLFLDPKAFVLSARKGVWLNAEKVE